MFGNEHKTRKSARLINLQRRLHLTNLRSGKEENPGLPFYGLPERAGPAKRRFQSSYNRQVAADEPVLRGLQLPETGPVPAAGQDREGGAVGGVFVRARHRGVQPDQPDLRAPDIQDGLYLGGRHECARVAQVQRQRHESRAQVREPAGW